MFILSLFPITKAALIDNSPKIQSVPSDQNNSIDAWGTVETVLLWMCALFLLIGFLQLLGAIFYYLMAGGEEPKMDNAYKSTLWGLIFVVVGIVLFAITKFI